MSENKKKDHNKSGWAKIATAAVAVAGIVFSVMNGGKKSE